MGWTSTHREPGMTDREFFEKEFPIGLTQEGEVVACATIQNVFYAAVRQTKENSYCKLGTVWALVVLIHRHRGEFNFSYKEMDETMGPIGYDGPACVLDVLTETDDKNALEWRAHSRASIAAKAAQPRVKRGDRIRFAQAMSFTDGMDRDTFEFIERTTFRSVDGVRLRIPNWKSRKFELVAS